MKRCSISLQNTEQQNKVTMKYHYTSTRWTKISLTKPSVSQDEEGKETFIQCWWVCIGTTTLESSFTLPSKCENIHTL